MKLQQFEREELEALSTEAIDLLRPIVGLGREHQIKCLRRLVDGQQITRHEANAQLAKGDELRMIAGDWMDADKARRRPRPWSDAIATRGRLSRLVALGMLPRPASVIVREWLGLCAPVGHRQPIDHEQRMRDAEGVFDVVGAV
jgi:hypothetical protein